MLGANLIHVHLSPSSQGAVLLDGSLRCAGEWPLATETAQSIGQRNQMFRSAHEVLGMDRVEAVALTSNRGCAIRAAGGVACFGNTRESPNGWFDAQRDALSAVPVAGLHNAVEIALTPSEAYARLKDGRVLRWGPPLVMGRRRDGAQLSPAPRALPLANVIQIAASWNHACALTKEGAVHCWGDLPARTAETARLPKGSEVIVKVAQLGPAVQIAVAKDLACARSAKGEVHCWGTHQSPAGPRDKSASPDPVLILDLPPSAHIAVSSRFSCSLGRNSEVHCWGENINCVLGAAPQGCESRTLHSTTGASETTICATPQLIPMPIKPSHIAIGSSTACAWDEHGEVVCWGRQLAQGSPIACKPERWRW